MIARNKQLLIVTFGAYDKVAIYIYF